MFKTAQKNLFVVDFIFFKMHKKSLFVNIYTLTLKKCQIQQNKLDL